MSDLQDRALAMFAQAKVIVETALTNTDSPTVANGSERPFDVVVLITFCAVIFIALDLVIAQRFGKERYYALHVMVNALILWFCVDDMLSSWKDPINSNACIEGKNCASLVPLILNIALHVYHPLAFKTNRMDWIHHIPAYIVQFSTINFLWGGNINFGHFAIVGLPGLLDYALLVALGQGLVSRQTYKTHCATINVWMRCPLAISSAFLGLLSLSHQWERTTLPQVSIARFIL
jgi:hypothetical protein